MNSKYVISYDLAVKLKELGFKQESEFYYHHGRRDWISKEEVEIKRKTESKEWNKNMITSLYMTDEILEILPDSIGLYRRIVDVDFLTKQHIVRYYHWNSKFNLIKKISHNHKLVDVLAEILILCIEKGYVKLDEK